MSLAPQLLAHHLQRQLHFPGACVARAQGIIELVRRRLAACMPEARPLSPTRTAWAQVVIELVRRRLSGQGDIGELLASLKEPAEAKEFRLRITPTPEHPDFKEVGKTVSACDTCGS